MHNLSAPEDFIIRFANLVSAGADVLDVAAGPGRHSLFFLQRSCRVFAIERDPFFVDEMRSKGVDAVEGDVENMDLLPSRFDVIVNTFFLYRPLLTQYPAALRPSGLLFFRTYTTDHLDMLRHTRPRREFLLEPTELAKLFPGLETVHYDETIDDRRAIATIVARKRDAYPPGIDIPSVAV